MRDKEKFKPKREPPEHNHDGLNRFKGKYENN